MLTGGFISTIGSALIRREIRASARHVWRGPSDGLPFFNINESFTFGKHFCTSAIELGVSELLWKDASASKRFRYPLFQWRIGPQTQKKHPHQVLPWYLTLGYFDCLLR